MSMDWGRLEDEKGGEMQGMFGIHMSGPDAHYNLHAGLYAASLLGAMQAWEGDQISNDEVTTIVSGFIAAMRANAEMDPKFNQALIEAQSQAIGQMRSTLGKKAMQAVFELGRSDVYDINEAMENGIEGFRQLFTKAVDRYTGDLDIDPQDKQDAIDEAVDKFERRVEEDDDDDLSPWERFFKDNL